MNNLYYSNQNHITNLISNTYYKNLIILRDVIQQACDEYFRDLGAPKVDLFMVTKGVSSPMGRGSDSTPVPFNLGKEKVYLVDSSQFGMEPLVQNNFSIVYCYLPSFRGEDADDRHLNQFYHCEAEIRGDYNRNIKIAEGLIKHIIRNTFESYKNGHVRFKKHNFEETISAINKTFPSITLDEAVKLLQRNKLESLVEYRPYGRVLSNLAEKKISELVSDGSTPVWITHYDRDTVPFYQKPDIKNTDKALNADLILPSINGCFGGEALGSGQRQDSPNEIIESMKRQGIKNNSSYEWYIDLRRNKNYKITSGFGMGIERFIAWLVGVKSIADAAVYPVIKNEKSIL